ncbi:isoprenoid synthase domain-containing protein [Fusarium venenatum]|uniref:isoprenoid synthase domain-containing protein n=1 Tax=Fusarium venenatum TaxID=56646 RepID=UPI001E124304|nr:isoprenoid synthase domain-containing protein [Fusarium venenatum]
MDQQQNDWLETEARITNTIKAIQLRSDLIKHIGPLHEFGGCNHINDAFLHDSVLEAEDTSTESQMQAEAGLRLLIAKAWKNSIDTTIKEKHVEFQSFEEYLEFRMIDTGAPFVEALMLFGMAMTLTPQEDAELGPIIRPCFAALALTNDYFSFDREMAEADTSTLINSVSIVMRLQNLYISTAKEVINETIQKYEREFLRRIDVYKSQRSQSRKRFSSNWRP